MASYGVPNNDGISTYNKCIISQIVGGQNVDVIGYMTEECQLAIRSIWESPFEGDSVGNIQALEKTSNLAQVMSEKTSKTQFNSQQTWQGNEPPELSITLKFIAYSDAFNEVDMPIRLLCQMASPELKEDVPVSVSDGLEFGGRIPEGAVFNIGRKMLIPMRISEVSFDVNAPKTKNGHWAYNTVTLTAAPRKMINKSQFPNLFK